MNKDQIYRLKSLSTLAHIPRDEIDWLVQHGNFEIYQGGLIALKGTKIQNLWIIMNGRISVLIDRGAGPKVVNSELRSGSITAMLPFSRLHELPGDVYADENTEILSISTDHFQEMIIKCPLFTAHTVHTMIDRARIHNTSAMQDEKMISMGRMAAGIAHELNNPASVAIRDAKLLTEYQTEADKCSRILRKDGLNEDQFLEIENLRSKCIERAPKIPISPIQKSDIQDNLADWLVRNQMDARHADQLCDLPVTTMDLDKLLQILPVKAFEPAIQWIIASCNLQKIAFEIEQSINQICKLVDSVKKFTHMDNLAEKELVEVEAGIRDALMLLDSKSKLKKAEIILEIDKNLPQVLANGAELNQVWFSLLDNALDAIANSGKIRIKTALETNFIVVRIIDNGPGIPADKLDRIFDPFYTTKPPGKGTGLGLDLSRRLIRSYNGDISVRSLVGETEFCVNLHVSKK